MGTKILDAKLEREVNCEQKLKLDTLRAEWKYRPDLKVWYSVIFIEKLEAWD